MILEVFHGYRRKAGCVTLVMACLFAAGWVREHVVIDAIVFPPDKTSYMVVESSGDALHWIRIQGQPPVDVGVGWWCFPKDVEGYTAGNYSLDDEFVKGWTVSYGSITTPLTLLSACLIHWPCKRATKRAAKV